MPVTLYVPIISHEIIHILDLQNHWIPSVSEQMHIIWSCFSSIMFVEKLNQLSAFPSVGVAEIQKCTRCGVCSVLDPIKLDYFCCISNYFLEPQRNLVIPLLGVAIIQWLDRPYKYIGHFWSFKYSLIEIVYKPQEFLTIIALKIIRLSPIQSIWASTILARSPGAQILCWVCDYLF